MKLFSCNACRHTLYFHNVECTQCVHRLGFVPDALELLAFDIADNGDWQPKNPAGEKRTFRPCANYTEHDACNWMVPTADTGPLCVACRPNRTIPDLSVAGNTFLWQRLQREKNRLVYSLLRLRLPMVGNADPVATVAFDPYACEAFQTLTDCWIPLTVALNRLNRSMVQADAYPFVLTPAMMEKLQLVHEIIRDQPTPPGGTSA